LLVDNTSGKETSRITISIGLMLYLYKSTEFSNLMTPWHAFDNKMHCSSEQSSWSLQENQARNTWFFNAQTSLSIELWVQVEIVCYMHKMSQAMKKELGTVVEFRTTLSTRLAVHKLVSTSG
jgi:hypothetical protein